MQISSALHLARPHHWIKNIFILAPVPFALADRNGVFDPSSFGLALTGFCLVNSAVYAFNDVRDASSDSEHPERRFRPIASGAISPAAGGALALLWLAAGLGLVAAAGAPARAWTVVLTYVGINVVYSLGAKRVPLPDVFLVASGFVIRVMLGCALAGVPITLLSDLRIRQPHLTLDGLSAPAPGVTIAKAGNGEDGETRINTWPAMGTCGHDVLVQGLRFVGGWTRVLHLEYGTAYAQQAGRAMLDRLKQQREDSAGS